MMNRSESEFLFVVSEVKGEIFEEGKQREKRVLRVLDESRN